MNENEITLKANVRLNRIRIVSQIFMVIFFVIAFLFGIFALSATYLWLIQGRAVNDQSAHVFASQYRALENIWPIVSAVTFSLGAWFSFKLFQIYGRGQLFTSENISNIRRIACIYFLVIIESVFFKIFINPEYSIHEAPKWCDWIFLMFAGFLILFIAWVMDEGRKIQEEQELTV